jgi:tetratricopeptide (TPR) repeat protein
MHKPFWLILWLGCLLPALASAQKAKNHVLTADEAKVVKKDASVLFVAGNFNSALRSYMELVKSDPGNADYQYKLGVCYLLTNDDKTAALEHLEKGKTAKDAKKEIDFWMGLAYMHQLRWDDAITSFSAFKTTNNNKPLRDFVSPERLIEMCRNGKELCTRPVAVTFTNPGKAINTVYDEYNPFISANGKQLVFTSRRKGNIGGFIEDLGIYPSDIYWSTWKDTAWMKAKGIGGLVNTDWDEEVVGMTQDGNQLFVYFDNAEIFGDLGAAPLKGKSWQRYILLPPQVNSKQEEGAAALSADGNLLIFSSDRKEGLGGRDLWMIRREKGEWSEAINLGPTINSKYDDDAPFLTLDGSTLYFASKGHNSMGGYDLFRCRLDKKTGNWSSPDNLGYPINTPDDDRFISFTADGRSAYVSRSRKGGFGDRDIWQLTFDDKEAFPVHTLVSGNILTSTGAKVELTRVGLEDAEGHLLQEYKPQVATTHFFLAVDPGKYHLRIEGYNFENHQEEFDVADTPLELNITVKAAAK